MSQPEPDATPWLSGAQLDDWRAVMALVMTLPVVLDAQLKRDSGMTLFEYHVLAALSESPHDEAAMSDLARLSQSSPSRLSHAVGRLEDAGLVVRGSCVAAGKRTSARLTPEGRARVESAAPGHVREVRRVVVDLLGPERFAALGDAGRAVVQAAVPELAAVVAPTTDRGEA